MINKEDNLFQFPEKLFKGNGNDYSYFGWEGADALALETIAEGYFSAAVAVYKKFKSSKNDFSELDKLGYPICFLYRHYMELYIKSLFFRYGEKGKRIKYLKKGHNLDELWNEIKPKLIELSEHLESRVYIPALTSYIHQMHVFDETSFSMRYPITKKAEPIRIEPIKLNIVNLHNHMNDFKTAIEKLNCDVSTQILDNIPDEELALMERKIDKYQKIILEFLNLAKQARNEMKSVPIRIFDSEDDVFSTEKKEYQKFIESQKSDFQRLVYDMFYCGRTIIQSHHCIKATNERKKYVLKSMVLQTREKICKKNVLLLFETKGADCLYQYTHKIVDELGMMSDKDE